MKSSVGIWVIEMSKYVFQEENHCYEFNFEAEYAVELNEKYRSLLLSDVDYVVETKDKVLLVEYKNSTISTVVNPEAFESKVRSDEHYMKIARKYYDSLIYLMASNKFKTYEYVYVLECKVADSVTRKQLTAKIMKYLPFELQKDPDIKHEMISNFAVLNIEEWNNSYGQDFPITTVTTK